MSIAPLKIFVSHSSKYVELARSLKLSLQALEADAQLDIRISAEMTGATDWRDWIEKNVRSANVFLLVYPHERMEMNWCNYELGRFYDPAGHIATVMNIDIEKPPPAFEPYQAYRGDAGGLLKFLNELFVTGVFTSGRPLNPAVGQLANNFSARARSVANELAQQFAQARVRDQFYDRRIVISLQYTNQDFDPVRTTVEGNPDGLGLLGLHNEATVSWSAVRTSLGSEHEWPAQLERSLSAVALGALPPSLSPFQRARDIYIPVITRAESVDKVLRQVVIIFVTVAREQMQSLLDWVTPPAMPDLPASLIRLVRMIFRARWDILEPHLTEAKFRAPSKERCANIVESIVYSYDQMRRMSEQNGGAGLAKLYGVFDKTLRPRLEELITEYGEAMQAFNALPAESGQEIVNRIERLQINNAHWLQLAAMQFSIFVNDLKGNDVGPITHQS
jgi:hypothetical protein